MLWEMRLPVLFILVTSSYTPVHCSSGGHISQRRKDFPTLFYPGSDRKFVTLAPHEVPISSKGLGLDFMFRSHSNNKLKGDLQHGHSHVNHVTPTELTQHESIDNFFTKTPQPEVAQGPANDVDVDQNLDFSVEGRKLPNEPLSEEESASTEAPQNFPKTPVQVIYVRPGSEQSPSLFDNSNNFGDQPIEPQGAQFPQASVSLTNSFQNFSPQDHNRQPHAFQPEHSSPFGPSKTPKALRPYPIGSELSIEQLVSPPPSVQANTVQEFHRNPHNLPETLITSSPLPDFSEPPDLSPQNFDQQVDFVDSAFIPKKKPLPQLSLPPPPTIQKPPGFRPRPLQNRPLPLSNRQPVTHIRRPSSETFRSTPPTTVRPNAFQNSFPSPSNFQPHHPPHAPQHDLNSLDSPTNQEINPVPNQKPPSEQVEFWNNHQQVPFGSQLSEPQQHIHFPQETSTPSFISSHHSPHLNQQTEQFSHASDQQQHSFNEPEHHSFHSPPVPQSQNSELGEFKKNEDQRFQHLELHDPAAQKFQPSSFPQPSNHQPLFQPLPQQQQSNMQSFQASRRPHFINAVHPQKEVWSQGNRLGPQLQADASQNPPFVSAGHSINGQGVNANSLHLEQHNGNNGESSAINNFGNAGIDFPIHSTIPVTSFSCRDQQYSGYYADVAAGCQVFHVCYDNNQFSFLCPNGTLFDQRYMVCSWWYSVDCSQATNLYNLNAIFASQDKRF